QNDSGLTRDVDRVVQAAHGNHAHRAARTMHQRNGGGQVIFNAVLVDGVRVPAADFHEVGAAGRVGEALGLRGQIPGQAAVAKLIHKTHAAQPLLSSTGSASCRSASISSRYACPSPSRNSSDARASCSSTLEIANPTWISTQSPGAMLSPSSR